MKNIFLSLCAFVCMASENAFATSLIKKDVIYKDGKVELAGHIIYKSEVNLEKAPAVVVIHNWMGISQETIKKAEDMADEGYVAFVADIYGKDIRLTTPKEAAEIAGSYKTNLSLLRKRVELAVKEVKKLKSKNIFIAGYCFGGTAAIEYARTGNKDVKGVVSFHGGLYASPDDKKIKTQVLVLHGAVDPAVAKVDLDAMLNSFDENKIDYDFISYSQAVHSFTDTTKVKKEATSSNAYNKKADQRSWAAFKNFISELSN